MTRARAVMVQRRPQLIPADEVIAKARRNPAYQAAYDALEEEFALVSSVIEARTRAKLTQEQLAKKMGTTQAVVARLESGRSMPSTRTLERFAKATGTKLRITFEPVKQGKAPARGRPG